VCLYYFESKILNPKANNSLSFFIQKFIMIAYFTIYDFI